MFYGAMIETVCAARSCWPHEMALFQYNGHMCLFMELMDMSVDKFYKSMHPLHGVVSNMVDVFIRRVCRSVRLHSWFSSMTHSVTHRLLRHLIFCMLYKFPMKMWNQRTCSLVWRAKSNCVTLAHVEEQWRGKRLTSFLVALTTIFHPNTVKQHASGIQSKRTCGH